MPFEKRGLTVVELMVTIGIVTLLMCLLFSGLTGMKERGKLVKCGATLKGMGVALQLYANENNFILPVLTDNNYELNGTTAIDVRFDLYPYDFSLWNAMCPSDPRSKFEGVDLQNPTFISYTFTAPGMDLGKVESPGEIMCDGYFHGRGKSAKTVKLFSDNHIENHKWEEYK